MNAQEPCDRFFFGFGSEASKRYVDGKGQEKQVGEVDDLW